MGSIEVKGSSAFYQAATGYANDYHTACPVGYVHVDQEPNATVSLEDLKNGTSQIAPSEMPSSFVRPILPDFEAHPVGVIVFTVIVNKEVTGITNLTLDQLRGIYKGTIKNWKNVNSQAPDIPIKVFGRPTDSGTYTTFTRYVLGPDVLPSDSAIEIKQRTDLMAQAVAQTPGAIGYVDEGIAVQMSAVISSVEIMGKAPTLGAVEHNTYSFWAVEHMYTKKNPGKLVSSFITYVTNHVETNDTFIKIQDMQKEILQTRV